MVGVMDHGTTELERAFQIAKWPAVSRPFGAGRPVKSRSDNKSSLFLQHQPALISDHGLQFFRELCQQPRECDRQTNMIIRHIDRTARHLTESAYAELQMIARPDFLLDRKFVAKSRGHAAKAGF
jgi:hypothetical protein